MNCKECNLPLEKHSLIQLRLCRDNLRRKESIKKFKLRVEPEKQQLITELQQTTDKE